MSRALSEIDADLAIAYEARRTALKAEEYSTDSGQGRTSAKRNLPNINATIRILEEERAEATGSGGSVFSISTDRGVM